MSPRAPGGTATAIAGDQVARRGRTVRGGPRRPAPITAHAAHTALTALVAILSIASLLAAPTASAAAPTGAPVAQTSPAASSAATTPSPTANAPVPLLFLGNKNIAPVVYLDGTRPAGLAVDIVRALAPYLSRPVEIRAMDWKEAQALVAQGGADALIQINATDARRKIYEFSDPLLESHFAMFVRSDQPGISSTSSLRGLRVGVEAGGLPLQLLGQDPLVPLTVIPDFRSGFQMLVDGSIDAVVVDYRVGSYVLATNGIRGVKAAGDPIASSWSAIAVRKGNEALLSEINDALQRIKTDGTYGRILAEWAGTEGVFETREQIDTRVFYSVILVLLILLVITIAWLLTVRRQMARRHDAEEALREQYSTLRGIIDTVPALVFSVDTQYRYTSFNAGHAAMMKALYGAEIERGHSMLDAMTVEEDRATARSNLDRALAGEQLVEEAYSGEEARSRKYFRVSHDPIRSPEGAIIGVAVLALDLTERRGLEEQLRQAQKMEAIGRLAGGIAHDFNNLLTAIRGYADIVVAGLPPDDPRLADMEEIRSAGVRASALTRQLLAFSRRQVLQPVVLDVDTVVAGLAPLLRRLIGEQIDLRTVATADLGTVRADPSQLEQVILNLVVNARDAMPAGGRLTIETMNAELDAEYARAHPGVIPGPYVALAVTDTGTGMDPETMAHLFEPFFTTKPVGEGTGLGLATAYGIVAQSCGHIAAHSEPGAGSTFRVYLPRVAEAAEPRVEVDLGPAVGGDETILLVEDDEAVRAFTARILGALGYTVLTAGSGDDALARAAAHDGPIDLLLSDVMLPGMSSRDLVERFVAGHPAGRILHISGYAEEAALRGGLLDPGVAFLPKPFTANELARKVRAVLEPAGVPAD